MSKNKFTKKFNSLSDLKELKASLPQTPPQIQQEPVPTKKD